MPGADLAPPALAAIVAGAIQALDLGPVTLVGNDSGGAVCQIVATTRPELVGRLVLTSCDAYDTFPPKFFDRLEWIPGARTFSPEDQPARLAAAIAGFVPQRAAR
ncbi:hypothetical protein F8568_017605 [Actinomadura sp. LD22]|uniref:AB hydrolase-1 domain-containing protein n=1 Tax=Actinomadura physcomitrii TaxID=2650748 RepID=A0A6I4MDS1_9ACTN|nr:alpha/beta hydrolase [Actinomadura physcomitrii]MWA02157.1 hypothetical protein [Actinomadura physcomitrii]